MADATRTRTLVEMGDMRLGARLHPGTPHLGGFLDSIGLSVNQTFFPSVLAKASDVGAGTASVLGGGLVFGLGNLTGRRFGFGLRLAGMAGILYGAYRLWSVLKRDVNGTGDGGTGEALSRDEMEQTKLDLRFLDQLSAWRTAGSPTVPSDRFPVAQGYDMTFEQLVRNAVTLYEVGLQNIRATRVAIESPLFDDRSTVLKGGDHNMDPEVWEQLTTFLVNHVQPFLPFGYTVEQVSLDQILYFLWNRTTWNAVDLSTSYGFIPSNVYHIFQEYLRRFGGDDAILDEEIHELLGNPAIRIEGVR